MSDVTDVVEAAAAILGAAVTVVTKLLGEEKASELLSLEAARANNAAFEAAAKAVLSARQEESPPTQPSP